MQSQPDTLDDVSALAWVQEELRKSLDAAHKSLRRTLKETESTYGSDLDDVEPALLRTARGHLHQGIGVLELVGLPAGAAMLRASEAVVQRYIAKPHKLDNASVEAIERASFALLDYLARRLAGKPVSPVAMFPQYKAVQEAAGAERIHPADLWPQDWQWHAVAAEPDVAPRAADLGTTAEFESQVLTLMRRPGPQITERLSELSAGLASAAAQLSQQSHIATLWQLAAAFFEAQSCGLLAPDVYTKRLTSRLLAQLRNQQRGDATAGERLAQDLSFFCAQAAAPSGEQAPRLAAVRCAYPLSRDAAPGDYATVALGRHDPAWVTQARKRVGSAKDSWSAVAGGEMHRFAGLNEQFALVADSLKRLVPGGEVLGEALSRAVGHTVHAASAPASALAMEIATSVLYLEAALEDGAFDHPDQVARIARLAQRIDAVHGGAPPEPLEPWMEELYRRVSDRQTLGSVVQELRAALSESEKLIDQFFRAPTEPAVLIPVPAQLQTMRGVLSVLGLDQATHAVLRMRDDVDALVAAGSEARHQQALFERLAGNLSALSFLIDLLGVQPQAAKSMFNFDAASGILVSQLVRHASPLEAAASSRLEPALIAQAQELADGASATMPLDEVSEQIERLSLTPEVSAQPELVASLSSAQAALQQASAPGAGVASESALREQLAGALAGFVSTASDPVGLDAAGPVSSARMPLMSLAPSAPVEVTGLEGDDEMREIFLEEAREVLQAAGEALAALREQNDDAAQLTTMRRAFHTLKGSSRMVGLNDFGEAAWSCEQLYNAWLASQQPAGDDLLACSEQALGYLAAWVEGIAEGDASGWRSGLVRRAADALRIGGSWSGSIDEAAPITVPGVMITLPEVPLPFELPAASDLDLAPATDSAPPVSAPTTSAEALAEPAAPPGLDFTFDLSDEAPTPAPAEPPQLLDFEQALADIDLSLDPSPGAAREVPALEEAIEPHTFDVAPTEPMSFEGPDTAGLDEAVITTLHLDMPAAPPQAVDAPDDVASETGGLEQGAQDDAWPAPSVEAATVAAVDSLEAEAIPVAEVARIDDDAAERGETAAESAEDAGTEAYNDQVKQVGPLRIGIPLFNIFLNEADELSRRLGTELAEWAHELHRPVGETAVALAHSLAGSSATVGFADLSVLARQLEHALMRSDSLGGGTPADAQLFMAGADEVRRLLHQFAAGFLKSPPPGLMEQLAAHELELVRRPDARASTLGDLPATDAFAAPPPAPDEQAPAAVDAPQPHATQAPEAPHDAPAAGPYAALGQAEFKPFTALAAEPQRAAPLLALDSDEDIDSVDAVDADLFVFFEEEAQELLPELSSYLRDWTEQPGEPAHAGAAMRTLHTLKGGARLAGAMRLGERAHRLETAIEHLLARDAAGREEIEGLLGRADALSATFEALRQRDALAYEAAQAVAVAALAQDALQAPGVVEPAPPASGFAVLASLGPQDTAPAEAPPVTVPVGETPASPSVETTRPSSGTEIDWSRFATAGPAAATTQPASARAPLASAAAVRVRTQLLDRMVNQAGEVSITRARLESEVGQIKSSLGDLTENLERLRGQLRDIELQAETQMSTRMEAAKAAAQSFDPLEFDRFTRFQELTRMMAESVNDVATVQRTLQRTLETAEDELAVQQRLTRDLQDDLLRTRMVEFEGLSERLYRVVRQAAKETGKQVRLDIVGGSIEVDRGVLDRMTGAFEHLLRNCITHGIETPAERAAAGKDPSGSVLVTLHQEGNEVSVEFRDDGAGLDLKRIRDKAVAMGLLDADATHADAELANMIFMPGLTTADSVTELAGRGVGMDVVRAEVNALGGRIETATAAGQGTSFKLVLPLTTAVTQVVMLRCGTATVAVPATLVEIVRRASPDEIEAGYSSGTYSHGDHSLPFFWLGALLQANTGSTEVPGRTRPVVVVRSAQQRVVLHIDEVLGNQEVVVKNLGPQLSRLPGLAGMTLLASGAVALIYNPVALATVYGEAARRTTAAARSNAQLQPHLQEIAAVAAPATPLILVVDDSLTVRRVTQRLLVREGYRVVLAKDGLEALERLADERPTVVLSDIEMPRMDGFDLVRNIRGDARLSALPVIMITSRIAQKHREYAAELGVNHYLGKPYSEEELLALIGRYCAEQSALS
ncbi:MAG: Hpt domain-containing protein [Methylibium sp.]|uniref:hybrid sensor histidine kinase/response regulator n=1 Tax=Methylibium sp. TaxID=2067992 RepID=UPI0017E00E02|nr:Hpt domain-containing protein [Methylibium sp.]MBA3596778.1 Hpt domain-containing protein [Methylibium sp.]